ncbi:hypothetical protein [Alloactinosynnema sp. L-07]|uniref:hypothetical protein n=1 Tax=Alloactinosynnema sp. L-07 TaxID=1653480 RepID=UPI00065EFEC1|nr:hypothetical protein [Alloactinosynnema sp. L-07]CRK56040.1 hypothetical protein [Alloactinosynnema sp. L-07]
MSRLLGISLALTGAAHFVVPKAFESVSRMAFPEETGRWIKRNGATELAIGLALTADRTRTAGAVGLVAYGAWLGSRLLKNR